MTPRFKFESLRRFCWATAISLTAAGCSAAAPAPDNNGTRTQAPPTLVQTATNVQSAAQASTRQNRSVFGYYLAGIHAKSRQDVTSAANYMTAALAQDPTHPALLREAFLFNTIIGKMDRAVTLARRMAETPAEHGGATLLRALARIKSGDLGAANTVLASLPEQGLSRLVQPLLGSWLALGRERSPESLKRLTDLDAIEGLALLRHIHTALIQDYNGNSTAASKAFEKALNASNDLSLRLAWLAANHYIRQGQRERGLRLMQQQQADQPDSETVRAILTRLENKAPTEPLLRRPEDGIAEALFNIASLLNQQGAKDLALLYTRLSLYMRPSFDFGRVLLAEILQRQERADAAISAYAEIPPDSPFHYVAQLRTATELQNLGAPEQAIARLEELAAAYPNRYEPLYRIGNIHRSRESFQAAATAYSKAVNRISKSQERHWSVYYFLGIALERTERWTAAEDAFETALELKPEQPYVMNYLAYSWVEQQTNLTKAQAMLRRAVEQRPEDGFIVDSLGWVYYRLGVYEKAVEYLERAVALRPSDPVINDHLGDAYWKVGRRREARFQWHRALDLDPTAEASAQIKSKLESGLQASSDSNG